MAEDSKVGSVPVAALIGARVAVTTAAGDTFEAEVFSYDPSSQVVVFQERSRHTVLKSTVRFLAASHIAELKCLGHNPDVNVSKDLPVLSQDRLEQREATAVRKAAEALKRLGVGVSPFAQELFNRLFNTHTDCRWDGQRIVVQGVLIQPPYGADNCSGGTPAALERIKLLVAKIGKQIASA